MSTKPRDEIWEQISPNDLDGDLREVARALGMKAARYLVESWGGLQIYVTSERSLLRPFIRSAIRRDWTGRNEGELARRYNVSRRDVVEAIQESPSSLDPDQTSLPLD